MTKLSEYLAVNNLFSEIDNIINYNFMIGEGVERMNVLLSLSYGDRTLYSKFEVLPLDVVANLIVTTFNKKWWALENMPNFDPNTMTEGSRVTETITNSVVRQNDSSNTDKVSAYNTDDLIADKGNESSNNENLAEDKNRVLTSEQISYKTLYENLSLSQKENIINHVLQDVSQFLTLSLY